MVVTLKAFCEQTGFPHKMIKSLANTGILPHWRQGRMYLFDKESTTLVQSWNRFITQGMV